MLFANRIAKSLKPPEIWHDIEVFMQEGHVSHVLARAGFPENISSSSLREPTSEITYRRLQPEVLTSPYETALFTAFNDYDRYAASFGDSRKGRQLSPLVSEHILKRGGRYIAFAEDSFLFKTGNLPLPCPVCGQATPAAGRWPACAYIEIFEYACCGSEFHYLRPYREWCFDKAIYVPASRTLYHNGHIHTRDEFLIGGYIGFQRSMAKALLFIQRNGPIAEQVTTSDNIAIMLGRGEMNPGHIIFEDFAGIVLLAKALQESGHRGCFDIILQESVSWYEDLLTVLPQKCDLKVERISNGMVEAMDWCLREARPLVMVMVHPCWPHTLPKNISIEEIRQAIISIPAKKGVFVKKTCLRVLFPLRVHNRSWEPQVDNVKAVITFVEKYYGAAHFILHGVGGQDPQYDQFRSLSEEKDNVSLLFDSALSKVLAEYAAADLVAGPIGSGFWWAGMHGTPCVTIHPKKDRDTVELGNWILPPGKGKKPYFLSFIEEQKCISIEENTQGRKAYGALTLPVSEVLEAVRTMILQEVTYDE